MKYLTFLFGGCNTDLKRAAGGILLLALMIFSYEPLLSAINGLTGTFAAWVIRIFPYVYLGVMLVFGSVMIYEMYEH